MATHDERADLRELIQHAFGVPKLTMEAWLAAPGLEWHRVVEGGGLVAAYGGLAMGQYFGGCEVGMWGIASVAVRRDALRRGHARRMMIEALGEARERGLPLSVLYASVPSLYAGVGYANAGACYELTTRCSALDPDLRGHRPVRLQPADPRLAALHEQAHRGHNGTVRRGDFLWFRALRGLGQQVWITGVEKDGVLRGYVAYQKLPADGHAPTVNVTDLVGADADAVGAAWAMVAALGAMGDAVKAKVPPWSPAGRSASRRDSRFSVSSVWMLRIADASAAMAARGWNPMVRGGIALDVRCDQGIATERLRLDVAEGRASVQPCGQAAVRVDVRGLAQLFTGWLPARQVRFAGLLDADDAACDTLDLLFAGPAPWMSARF